ncbi:hypothetical protein ABK040_001062 [Willaertia magna]
MNGVHQSNGIVFNNSGKQFFHTLSSPYNSDSNVNRPVIMERKEVKIGESAELEKAFTEKDIELFANLVGDFNPVHFDSEYAKQGGVFEDKVVHGVLVFGLLSTLAGTILPGKGSIFMSQDIRFVRPVYINELVKASITLKEAHSTMKSGDKKVVFVFNTEVRKSNGEIALTGQARIYHPNLSLVE